MQKTQTKKKRAWSPLKTTRYGVSARRPKEEPGTAMFRGAGHGSSKDAPAKGFGNLAADRLMFKCPLTLDISHIRVETVERIVGELR